MKIDPKTGRQVRNLTDPIFDLGPEDKPVDRSPWTGRAVPWRLAMTRSTGWARQNVSPMVGMTFLREEGRALEAAFSATGRRAVFDPYPGTLDLVQALEAGRPGLQVLGPSPGTDPLDLPALPAQIVISAVPRGAFGACAVHAIARGATFLALMASGMQLAGEGRWLGLFRQHPPSRVWLYSASRACTTASKKPGGSAGTWNPCLWAIWDGHGRTVKEVWAESGRPQTVLGWIPDRAALAGGPGGRGSSSRKQSSRAISD